MLGAFLGTNEALLEADAFEVRGALNRSKKLFSITVILFIDCKECTKLFINGCNGTFLAWLHWSTRLLTRLANTRG